MNLAAFFFSFLSFFFFKKNSNAFDYPHMHAMLTPTPTHYTPMPAFAEDLSSDLDAVPGQELREDAPEGSLLAHCFSLETPFSCSHIYPLLLSFEFPFPVPLHTLFSSVGLRGTQETKHMSKTNTSYVCTPPNTTSFRVPRSFPSLSPQLHSRSFPSRFESHRILRR
jgi:hypothetical protein